MQETSRIAYKQIIEEGTMNSQKEHIVMYVHDFAQNNGLSLREICKGTGLDINAVSGRVNELKKNGNIEECDKRRCRITGRLVTPVTVS